MKKILLIDDDRKFLQATARALLVHGYRVEEALDGLEGLQKALQDPPDVLVVDLVMPKVGGADLVAFFRQNSYLAPTPIILLSGVLLETASLVEELQVDFVVPKGPLKETAQRLLSALEAIAQGKRQRKPVLPRPGMHERRQVVELLNITRDLESVLEHTAAGIIELDVKGRVIYANSRAEELLGVDRACLIGTDVVPVVPEPARASFQALLSAFQADTSPTSRAMTAVVEDRALRSVLTSIWNEEALQSVVVTLFEVAQGLEAQNRPRQLLRFLSHEMRSSLLIVDRYLRSLVRAATSPHEDTSDASQTAILSFLVRETARLQRLLADANHFDRTLQGLPEMEMQPIDPVHVVKEGLRGIMPLASPRGIRLHYRGPSLVPEIRGHHDRLLQVLYNLLLNALKATPRNGSVDVELRVEEEEILVTVADTGCGMSAEALQEVLARAQRPELFLSQRGKRIGLGLSIAFQIIHAHGGRLEVESRPGTGSRFTFALPVSNAKTSGGLGSQAADDRLRFEPHEETL